MTETIKLLRFRAAYNLPVYAGIEVGIFARHALTIETAYTPDSLYVTRALKEGRCDIGHTAADDVIADVENDRDRRSRSISDQRHRRRRSCAIHCPWPTARPDE